MFNKKIKISEDCLINDEIRCQNEKLDSLRKSTKKLEDKLSEVSDSTKKTIQHVSGRLQSIPKRKVKFEFSPMNDDGILFLNYKGEIIHTNTEACQLLAYTSHELTSKTIDYILTGKTKKISILGCSELIMKSFKKSYAFEQVCDSAKTALLLKTDNIAIHLDEPVCIVFKEGNIIHSLRMIISLLDISPNHLEDITYICKLNSLDKIEENIPIIEVAI